MKFREVIALINGVACKAEATVEAAYTLSATQADRLVEALQYGTAHIRVLCASETGTCPFTLTALEFSIDGTNYATLRTFDTAIDCTANGEKALTPINGYAQVSDHRITKLRFVMGGSAPDNSNYITVTAQLVLQVP